MGKLFIIFVIELMARQFVLAQGEITYLSNLGQAPTGSNPVGGDSWIASTFRTGNNGSGYLLDSVQLGMTDVAGNPSGFTAMIFTMVGDAGSNPGSSLGILTGPANPSTVGTYTYPEDSNLILLPGTIYFIVLTAGTTVANGAYEWSLTSPISYGPSGGWGSAGGVWKSSDGSSWHYGPGAPLFAITATPVPEPSAKILLSSGGILLLGFGRWKAKSV